MREARGVRDELLPFCRIENLYGPFERYPPPGKELSISPRPDQIPAAKHRPRLLVTNPESLVRPDNAGLHQGCHVGKPLGEPGRVSPDTEDICEEEISDDGSPDHPGSHSLRPGSSSKVAGFMFCVLTEI